MWGCVRQHRRSFLWGTSYPRWMELYQPTIVCKDNEGGGDWQRQHKQTRHVDIMYHYIKEQLKMKTIQLLHIANEEQLVDALTKGFELVPRGIFRKLIFGM